MNTRVKQKWVEALRSKTYKQGKYRLRCINDSYCCLGVLCDLYLKEKGGEWQEDKTDMIPCYSFQECSAMLPNKVMEWAGLNNVDPVVYSDVRISRINDNGNGFDKIADLIEQEL